MSDVMHGIVTLLLLDLTIWASTIVGQKEPNIHQETPLLTKSKNSKFLFSVITLTLFSQW